MMTTWGETLSADNVWPEYPRPQMVRTGWQNLNGYWHYAVRPQHEPQPTSWDGEILVPFCIESALSGVRRRFEPTERLWYRRSVVVDRPDERTIIHLGAVDHHCAIWLNGAFVGAHSGGFDAFSLDLTLFLRSGGNELVIAVDDPSSSGEQPRGKQHLRPQGIWYTPVTGIWQTVWLEQVPLANHIDDVRIVPTPDCNGVTVEVLLARPTRDPELAVELVVRQASAVVSSTLARPDRRVLIA
ncbi:MAG: glycoside hydrolase family 2, partial [Gammaproteobacteria bacterium]|nr:glycoside hydrolase family 2 [Gammaproteobacteria bacterium]